MTLDLSNIISNILLVSNIPRDVSNSIIFEYFQGFSEINSVTEYSSTESSKDVILICKDVISAKQLVSHCSLEKYQGRTLSFRSIPPDELDDDTSLTPSATVSSRPPNIIERLTPIQISRLAAQMNMQLSSLQIKNIEQRVNSSPIPNRVELARNIISQIYEDSQTQLITIKEQLIKLNSKIDFDSSTSKVSNSYKKLTIFYIFNSFPHYNRFFLMKAMEINNFHLIPSYLYIIDLQNKMEEEDLKEINKKRNNESSKEDTSSSSSSSSSPSSPSSSSSSSSSISPSSNSSYSTLSELTPSTLRSSILPFPSPQLSFSSLFSSSSEIKVSARFLVEVEYLQSKEREFLKKQRHNRQMELVYSRLKDQSSPFIPLPPVNFETSKPLSSFEICYNRTCYVCDEEFPSPFFIECPNQHPLCLTCLEDTIEATLNQGSSKIVCQFDGCNLEFNDLNEKLFNMNLKQRLNKVDEDLIALSLGKKIVSCPFCSYFEQLPEDIDKPTIFKCKKNSCQKLSCQICSREAHKEGVKCPKLLEAENEESLLLFIKSAIDNALIRYCPACNLPVWKDGGCNHLRCQCGNNFCYVCRKNMEWQDNPSTHYTDTKYGNKCKQFTNQEEDEEKELMEAAVKAEKEWRGKHPSYVAQPVKLQELIDQNIRRRKELNNN